MILQFVINGVITGILYSLLAIGFALVYNTTKVFHIAAAALYVFAAYLFYFFTITLEIPVILAVVISLLFTSWLSLLMDVSVYRPLDRRGASSDIVMIASIGMMTVVINLLVIVFGSDAKVVRDSASNVISFLGVQLATPQLIQAIIGGGSLILFLLFLGNTRWGLHLRALSSGKTLYCLLGHNPVPARNVIFLASGAFIALSSCLSVYDLGIDAHMGMDMLVNAMVAMILGGAGRFGACAIGGISLGLLQSLSVFFFSSHWESAITFALLLLLLFLRPQGILGYKERRV